MAYGLKACSCHPLIAQDPAKITSYSSRFIEGLTPKISLDANFNNHSKYRFTQIQEGRFNKMWVCHINEVGVKEVIKINSI